MTLVPAGYFVYPGGRQHNGPHATSSYIRATSRDDAHFPEPTLSGGAAPQESWCLQERH